MCWWNFRGITCNPHVIEYKLRNLISYLNNSRSMAQASTSLWNLFAQFAAFIFIAQDLAVVMIWSGFFWPSVTSVTKARVMDLNIKLRLSANSLYLHVKSNGTWFTYRKKQQMTQNGAYVNTVGSTVRMGWCTSYIHTCVSATEEGLQLYPNNTWQ